MLGLNISMLLRTSTILLRVTYFRIDYPSLLNEFLWSFSDRLPDKPRMNRFLQHWYENIEAPIQTIEWAHTECPEWRRVDHIGSHY